MSKPLVLASQSPHRQQLLTQLGVDFISHAPTFDEEQAQKDYHGDWESLSGHLARGKALSLVNQFPDQWILGSDQVLLFEGQALHKPKTREEAIHRLKQLEGQSHQLSTAYCLNGPKGQQHSGHVIANMTMHNLNTEEIESYVDLDQGLGCAGGYKIEAHGVRLFKQIQCEDFFSIIGLPLLSLGSLFRNLGILGPKSSDSFSTTAR